MEYLSLLISSLALIISGLTFWLTKVKAGVVKMTAPTMVFFGPEGREEEEKKIFIRTLLYSTADKGKYVRSMYAKLTINGVSQNFNIWGYGDEKQVLGSGLYIEKSGISTYHHFYLPKDVNGFSFHAGKYVLEIYADCVNERPRKLFDGIFIISESQQKEMKEHREGIMFNWDPSKQAYISHVDDRVKKKRERSDFLFREGFRDSI